MPFWVIWQLAVETNAKPSRARKATEPFLQTEMTSLQDKLLAKVKTIGQLLSPSPEAGTYEEEASGTEVAEEPTSAETVSEE